MFKSFKSMAQRHDAELVMHSLGGDREAFCEIVSRYQNLLCSVAYAALGDLKQSEDVTQEAFIEAWRKLDTLRDPEKLKSWLCGILRFKISHYHRKETQQPTKHAQEIQEDSAMSEGNLDDEAIQVQQEALLWRAIANMETHYREPLILFYREQQSVQAVAEKLDLSEDTAKQRLSRGRKLLKQAMSAFVEEALKNSKPGTAFTAAVFTAISGIAPPAKAAALGASATKASGAFSLSGIITLLAIASGFISAFFGLRAGLDQTRTEKERQLVIRIVMQFILAAVLFTLGMLGTKALAYSFPAQAKLLAWLSQYWVLIFALFYFYLARRMLQKQRQLRMQERIFQPESFAQEDLKDTKRSEFKSKLTLFGVPLVHVQFAMPEEDYRPAIGWIAGGSYAKGLLFAWGGVAIAPISVGIISVGVLSIGAIGFGVLSMGTVAIGLLAFGASAIGIKAWSSLSSLGWESAISGGFAIANDAAVGAIAFAEEANTEIARELVQLAWFQEFHHWPLALLAIMVIVPSILYARNVRQRMAPPRR
ncbi:RNA polymerase sigma factor [Planctobacterium marinum]|uniref:RNA polymerase sigma factor n=1 Tax=Planctobacterium marinum TaxID=1631968 RepID=A0AA48HMX5_9ALTE|nr:DNA-directed RNA polymerase sigma-70 factor [Planctobacterium marinum]